MAKVGAVEFPAGGTLALALLAALACESVQAGGKRVQDPSMDMVTVGPTRLIPSKGHTGEVPPATGICGGVRSIGDRLDCAHDWLYVRTQNIVENTDHWFAADDIDPVDVPLAPLRIGTDGEYFMRPDGGEFDFDLDLDATLRLPNLERRLRIFFTSEDLDESPNRPLQEESDVRAGLRFELPKSFDFDIGARAKVPPEAFATLKWRTVQAAGSWRFYPFAKVYVESDEGAGAAAAFTVDRWWGRIVARSSTYMNWDDTADAIEWDQTLSFGYARELLDDRRYAKLARGRDLARGFGANFSVLGAEISGAMSYRIELFYKQPLRGRWLYWGGGPLVRWDREYNWNPDYGARLGVDALFWGLVGH